MTEYYVDVRYKVEADSILQAIEVINEKGKTARTDEKIKNYSIGAVISCNSELRSKCLYYGWGES